MITGPGVHLSPVSIWEIETKLAIGKLDLPGSYAEAIGRMGFQELALTISHAAALRGLPLHHRDPFDRMLIAQAIAEDLTLVSADLAFAAYPVRVPA